MLTEDGPLHVEVPRDREGSFEPALIPKHERRFTDFDYKIVAMYARGITVREIQVSTRGPQCEALRGLQRSTFERLWMLALPIEIFRVSR